MATKGLGVLFDENEAREAYNEAKSAADKLWDVLKQIEAQGLSEKEEEEAIMRAIDEFLGEDND